MTVQLGEIVATLCAQVVVGEGPYLMGHHQLGSLKVNIGQVNLLEHDMIKEMLDKHGTVKICRDFKSTLKPLSPYFHEWMTFLLIFLEASFSPSWTCPMPTYTTYLSAIYIY